jgi:chromosome segregation ATPase
VLYLAEVQKQKGGLLSGGAKTELKLLACQRSDQNWSNTPEEVVAAEEASKLNDGALVMVELSPNRQVQRVQEAGRPLVNILQNFSRQLEKFKLKEDEIDQWKQSLTFQAQELNRREMDMEARLEQLQELEDDFQRLETQKQEVDTSREEIERLQAEIERNRQELEGAWEHLRGEQRRLEEFKADCQQGQVLDEEQSRAISELLNRLSGGVVPTQAVQEQLNFAFELVERQQATLNPHWEKLENQRTTAAQQQEEVERLWQTVRDRQNLMQEVKGSLEQQLAQLHTNTATLASKEDYVRVLKEQLRYQEDLYQQINCLAESAIDTISRQQVDVEALQRMPLEELQKMVQDLQNKLTIDSSFVHDQEQELNYKQETIEELERKIQQSSSQDVRNLQIELAEEKDLYQMLNETLVGQRRSLLERQKALKQHQSVLRQRQGFSDVDTQTEFKADLEPILLQINNQRQQMSRELQKLEQEIEQIRAAIELDQGNIGNQTQELEEKGQELKTMEENLLNLRTATAECWGRVNLYQEALQPIQDSLDGLRHKLQGIEESLTQAQETGDTQLQAITQIRQTLQSLTPQPELLAS